MLSSLRNVIADTLWLGALRKHRSRMGWRDAPKYSKYLEGARKSHSTPGDREAVHRAKQFAEKGWASFEYAQSRQLAQSMLSKIREEEALSGQVFDANGRYNMGDIYQKFPEVDAFFHGQVGDFLRATFKTDFKIFYGVLYKSIHDPAGPSGSQLWHADGGPGTCINLMWCLSPVSAENGAMECLNWADSLRIFEGERRATRTAVAQHADRMAKRTAVAQYYRDTISRDFSERINQPMGAEGLVFAFSNNTIHKGGFPQAGHERYVCVFHIYPSAVPTPFEHYIAAGIPKTASNPSDPAFGDNA